MTIMVQDNSPGSRAGLEAFFDFIVAIGNTRLNQDNDTLKDLLKANLEKPTKMTVFSSKSQSIRDVTITPSLSWGGQGLLGVSIRFCSFEGASENIWHVMEVQPNSPASAAGFISDTDYIIGADTVLNAADDLFTLIEGHEGKPLKLYVYNLDEDRCREVTITPNGAWGGEGSLGCGIGYGYLHRIPSDLLEEKRKQRAALSVPHSMQPPQPAAPVQPTSSAAAGTSTTTSADGFSEVPLDNSDAPPAQPTASSSHTQSDSSELSGLALSASLVSTGTPTVPALSPARYTPQATFTSAGAMGAVYNPSVSSPVSTTQTSAIVSSVIPGDASSSPPQPSAVSQQTPVIPDLSNLNLSGSGTSPAPPTVGAPLPLPTSLDSFKMPPIDLTKLPPLDPNLLKNQSGLADLGSLPPMPQMPMLNLGTMPTIPSTTTSTPTTAS
ncbi:GORASP1 [Bugula neritina]|uniref:GORASP1 n=1 Tax=Bugula neritina TaxID=10212 RepID=A0A7J7KAV4_BUGNE|nr:GORASP1 [Bugula neritina]